MKLEPELRFRTIMNIQFHHKRKVKSLIRPSISGEFFTELEINPAGGETISFHLPEAWLLETLEPSDFFTKPIGKARCSDSENYCKKTGRELAFSRMKPTILTCISNLVYTGNVRIVTLTDKEGFVYTLKVIPRTFNEQETIIYQVRFVNYG